MKQTKQTLRHLLWSLIAFSVALSSCTSKKEKMLESVPFDAEYVATIDLVQFAAESKMTIEDGRLVLPSEYNMFKEHISSEQLKIIGQIAKAVDLENIVAFGYINRGRNFLTAPIKDADALRSLLKNAGLERDRQDGWEIFSESSSDYADVVAISQDETQIWFVERRKEVANLDDFELAKKKNNILRYSGLADALTKDNIANVVFDQTVLKNGMDTYWAAATVTIDNNALIIKGSSIKPDGTPFKTTGLQPVDTDFIRYMPANFIGALAFGINPDGQWTQQLEAMARQFSSKSDYDAFSQALPYLKAIDGTVAFGFGPKNKSALLNPASPTQWQALLMAHMPQSKINELTETFRSNLPGSTSVSNGLYRFNSQEVDFYYGSVDGYFTLTLGMAPSPDKSNSFTSDFDGKPLAAVFQTPLLGSIVDDASLNYSIKTSLEMNDSEITLQLNLVGTESPIIPTLVSTLPLFAEKYTKLSRL